MARVVSPRSWPECRILWEKDCERLANEAASRYLHNVHEKLYLYGEKRMGNLAEGYYDLTLFSEASTVPESYSLLIQMHVPRDKSLDQLKGWFVAQLVRTPLGHFCD